MFHNSSSAGGEAKKREENRNELLFTVNSNSTTDGSLHLIDFIITQI